MKLGRYLDYHPFNEKPRPKLTPKQWSGKLGGWRELISQTKEFEGWRKNFSELGIEYGRSINDTQLCLPWNHKDIPFLTNIGLGLSLALGIDDPKWFEDLVLEPWEKFIHFNLDLYKPEV